MLLPKLKWASGYQNPNPVDVGIVVGAASPQTLKFVPSYFVRSAEDPSEIYVMLPMVVIYPCWVVVLFRIVVSDVGEKSANRAVVSTNGRTVPFRLRLE